MSILLFSYALAGAEGTSCATDADCGAASELACGSISREGAAEVKACVPQYQCGLTSLDDIGGIVVTSCDAKWTPGPGERGAACAGDEACDSSQGLVCVESVYAASDLVEK